MSEWNFDQQFSKIEANNFTRAFMSLVKTEHLEADVIKFLEPVAFKLF